MFVINCLNVATNLYLILLFFLVPALLYQSIAATICVNSCQYITKLFISDISCLAMTDIRTTISHKQALAELYQAGAELCQAGAELCQAGAELC